MCRHRAGCRRAGDEPVVGLQEAQRQQAVPSALELKLELEARPPVSNVSARSSPSSLPSGSSFWVLVSPSVKWVPEIKQDECEAVLGLGVVCFEKGGLEWHGGGWHGGVGLRGPKTRGF